MSPEELILYDNVKPVKVTVIATVAGFEIYLGSKLAHFYKARGFNWGVLTLSKTGFWDVTELPL